MLENDITIIGAGPSGSLAAWEIKRKDPEISVTIFEEHSQIGKPVHCSGLIAMEGFPALSVDSSSIRRKILLNRVRRAKFIGPNYNSFEIDRKSKVMAVVDRITLDRLLAERAINAGTKLLLKYRIKRIFFDKKHWNCQVKQKKKIITQKSKIIISAEGVHARLTSSIGLSTPSKKWLFPAIQYEYSGIQNVETDCTELYFGRKYAPGFFGWFIPINENSARVGIAVNPLFSGKTRFFMKQFVKKHPFLRNRLKGGNIIHTFGGFVPVAGPIKKTYSNHFMVVGDAAGQSKATTGGGVNIGGYCGRIAGLMARRIITGGTSPFKGCREYQHRWKARFEPDLSLMKLFRRLMTPLPDKAWNNIIQIAKETDIGANLQSSSIDLHGLNLLKYSLSPRVLIKGLHLVPTTAVSLLRGLIM